MCRKVVLNIVKVIIWAFVFVSLIYSQSGLKLLGEGYRGGVHVRSYRYGWPLPYLVSNEEVIGSRIGMSNGTSATMSRRIDVAGCLVDSIVLPIVLIFNGVWLRFYVGHFFLRDLFLLTACSAISVTMVFGSSAIGYVVFEWIAVAIGSSLVGTATVEQMPIWVKAGLSFGIAITMHAMLKTVMLTDKRRME